MAGTYNISQNLFRMDETLVRQAEQDDSVSGPTKNFGPQFSSYMNQARVSTYFQDNPWDTITFSEKFGLVPPGGRVNTMLTPGSRPGNVIPYNSPIDYTQKAQVQREFVPMIDKPVMKNGLYVPKNMALNWPKSQNNS